MSICQQAPNQFQLYLDNELDSQEKLQLEKHLQNCISCKQIFDQQQYWLTQIRHSKPLYQASANLQSSIEKILDDCPKPYQASAKLHKNIDKLLSNSNLLTFPSKSSIQRLVVAVAATVIILLTSYTYLSSYNSSTSFDEHSEFALMAVNTHIRHQKGKLPLEIKSDSAQDVSTWFLGKVSFSLTLPNYQESSGQEKLYQLEGARLVGFKNDYAAYISYQMQQRPISLIVTANTVALPDGGEKIISKGLTFHCEVIDGLKVISWTDHGLTYALISDLAERGQQSCVVCHTGTKDKDFIDSLKIKS
ncbi:MAG: zf-HC2 domain-containing protein [Blastocatellia bacterium]|nr:zf-HC2 domain-containing protein [Blastocatellia bacterium]MBN8724526.1 zf-HC2 domain-containing protein [Acidobacteriota bacterium]